MLSKIYCVTLFVFLVACSAYGQPVGNAKRKVTGRTLISTELPVVRMRFGKDFKFVGSHDFILFNRAKAEQYFFVDSKGGKIRRMFMVQFEGLLPDATGGYEYNEPSKVDLGGVDYFANAEAVPNVSAALSAVPDSDISKAAKFLSEKGLTLPEAIVYQRFVRTVDPAKRHEIILLYVEAAGAGKKEDQGSLKDLSARALGELTVLK